jgi:hypothetical protein
MSSFVKSIVSVRKREIARTKEIRLRRHLNVDALITTMRNGFAGIKDHRSGTVIHTLADSLMAGFAMFSLKDPSLLAFDERRLRGLHISRRFTEWRLSHATLQSGKF